MIKKCIHQLCNVNFFAFSSKGAIIAGLINSGTSFFCLPAADMNNGCKKIQKQLICKNNKFSGTN